MKPFTKGMWLGILIGSSAAFVIGFMGVMGLSLFMNTSTGKTLIGQFALRPLSFPADTEFAEMGVLDPDWVFRTLYGEDVPVDRFRGRPMFLNVWATWCFPCVMEMPEIASLGRSLEGEGVAFVLVSDEDVDVVREFVRDKDPGLPIYLMPEEIPEVLQSSTIPLTLIADSQGKIVFRHAGAAKWNHENTRNFLRSLTGN